MKTNLMKQHVGIDIAKDDFKACYSVMDSQLNIRVKGSHSFKNTTSGIQAFIQWVDYKRDSELAIGFTMEATGVYYENLAYYLHENGFSLSVVLPNHAKKYIQSLGIRSKTDKIDARALSRMGLERNLRLWQPVSNHLRQLKQLTRERSAIVVERTRTLNQLHAYRHQGKPNQESITRSLELIALLEQQAKAIEKEISVLVRQDKELEKRLNYLLSIPGVGLLTAVTIVAETNGFATITNIKQLTGFAGMDITIAESGKWKGKSKISKKGNSHIRKALYMPSLSMIQADSKMQKFYQRLKLQKGKGMIAAVAVQRKLLGLMYTLWKKQEMFVAAA